MAAARELPEPRNGGLSGRERRELAWFDHRSVEELERLAAPALARYRRLVLRFAETAASSSPAQAVPLTQRSLEGAWGNLFSSRKVPPESADDMIGPPTGGCRRPGVRAVGSGQVGCVAASRARRSAQRRSTSAWRASMMDSLPGAKTCLKRPWGFSQSVTGRLSLGLTLIFQTP